MSNDNFATIDGMTLNELVANRRELAATVERLKKENEWMREDVIRHGEDRHREWLREHDRAEAAERENERLRKENEKLTAEGRIVRAHSLDLASRYEAAEHKIQSLEDELYVLSDRNE